MSLFEWNDSFQVSVPEFDAQHRRLVRYVNELYEAIEARKSKEVLSDILDGLIHYTQTHFAAEERLMQQHDYPGYITHKAEHDDLIRQVTELKTDFDKKGSAMSLKVLVFLKDWVRNHILETDKQYGPFFREKGIH